MPRQSTPTQPTSLKEVNQLIWQCRACPRCPYPSMPGFFPKDLDVLVIGQNPGQLHKRKTGWNDADYAFNDEDWPAFQRSYAKGLLESPIGEWVQRGFRDSGLTWGLTNIVKCRTDDNKVYFEEQGNCRHWTEDQLRFLKPKAIINLGAVALSWWDLGISIDRLEGKILSVQKPFWSGLMMTLYHPAYRQYKFDKFSRIFFERFTGTIENRQLFTTALKMNKIRMEEFRR